MLLEANQYRERCGHPLYEVHPELAFAAMAGQPLAHSKHTPAGRDLWVLRLGDDGRCSWFEEWPFWPEQSPVALG